MSKKLIETLEILHILVKIRHDKHVKQTEKLSLGKQLQYNKHIA